MQLGVEPKALAIPDSAEVFRQVRSMGIFTKMNKKEARKMARLTEVFEDVDDDASGFIDDAECVELLGKLGKDITIEEAQTLIASVDEGGAEADGFLEFSEFCLLAEQIGCECQPQTEAEAKACEKEAKAKQVADQLERDRQFSIRIMGAASLTALAEIAGINVVDTDPEPSADQLAEEAYDAAGSAPPEVPDVENMTPREALVAEIRLWEEDIGVLQHKASSTVGLRSIKAKKQLLKLLQARDKKRQELAILEAVLESPAPSRPLHTS